MRVWVGAGAGVGVGVHGKRKGRDREVNAHSNQEITFFKIGGFIIRTMRN